MAVTVTAEVAAILMVVVMVAATPMVMFVTAAPVTANFYPNRAIVVALKYGSRSQLRVEAPSFTTRRST